MNLNPFAWHARRKAEAAAAARVAAVLTREAVFVPLDTKGLEVVTGMHAHFSIGMNTGVASKTATFLTRPGTIVGMMVYLDTGEIIRPVYADER
jgi:hypothetical protein